ncbi:nickel-responsive transcriptional regulator NikR [Candidatus Bathyarchaeota archaeon]|nr:nickel-responsive transcriptional regulator NikR [Candidatus Bathyarchaeota archaeon]
MAGKGVSRISISLPPELLLEFDEMTKQIGYDRSKAVQMAIRNYLTEYRWTSAEGETGSGAVIILYDHDTKDLEQELTDIQHRHQRIISSSMHIHLDEHNCLEIIATKGGIKEIKNLAQDLMTKRGVKQLKLAVLTQT